MARLCERPGCSQEAAVAYGVLADRRLVWIDRADPDELARTRAGALCRRHADAMVVPRGWSLDDRREAAPRLFRAPTAEPTEPRPRPPRRARPDGPAPEPALTLFDLEPGEATVAELVAATEADGPEVAAAPEGSPPVPWRPVFDEHDDLGGQLAARTPLLARAFRAGTAEPPRPGR